LGYVKREYTCWQQEIFGPVFTVAKGANNEELIKMANDTQYGLAAVVFTGNP
jgi:acyl-CoA reductase-like NAD-dependent aldehyde dehydrogenase